MRRFLYNKCVELTISLFAIFFICYLPFTMDKTATDSGFTYTLKDTISQLLNPNQMMYFSRNTNAERPLFPAIWEKYIYTMELLAIGFFIALAAAVGLVFLYTIFSAKMQRVVKAILKMMESFPDVMIVLILQLTVIHIYRLTGFEITNLYALGDERVYVIPLVSLTVIPAIMIYKMMILSLDEEFEEMYVEYARAKGIGMRTILFKHMFRNIFFNILNHGKTILLFMLSTLFVVEGLSNINGFMMFIINDAIIEPGILILWALMLFIPFYIIFTISELYIAKTTGVFTS